jgi:hypothetical protein
VVKTMALKCSFEENGIITQALMVPYHTFCEHVQIM